MWGVKSVEFEVPNLRPGLDSIFADNKCTAVLAICDEPEFCDGDFVSI